MFVVSMIIILCFFKSNLKYRREFDNLEDSLQRELGLFNVMTTSVKISEVGFPPRKYILSLVITKIKADSISQPKSSSSFRVYFLMPKL